MGRRGVLRVLIVLCWAVVYKAGGKRQGGGEPTNVTERPTHPVRGRAGHKAQRTEGRRITAENCQVRARRGGRLEGWQARSQNGLHKVAGCWLLGLPPGC